MVTEYSDTESDLPPEVIRAIEQGRKIEAIKLLREATGIGLANAKVLVDRAFREHRPKPAMPDLVTEESGIGKLLMMLAIVAVAFFLYHQFIDT